MPPGHLITTKNGWILRPYCGSIVHWNLSICCGHHLDQVTRVETVSSQSAYPSQEYQTIGQCLTIHSNHYTKEII